MAVGAGVGDWIAQSDEIETGERTAYNPYRTGAEVASAGFLSKYTAGKAVVEAVVKGAAGNMLSDTFINLSEGKGLPSTFELAMTGLGGAALGGASVALPKLARARFGALREITSSDEVATRAAKFMTPVSEQQFDLELKPKMGQTDLDFRAKTPDLEVPTPTRGPRRRSDWEIQEQMGFDDVEEGRTFEKLFNNPPEPDQPNLNLKYSGSSRDQPWKVYQIGSDEQAEWAKLKALARGKKEMLDTPGDRDPDLGDVSPATRRWFANWSGKGRKEAITEGMKRTGRPKEVAKRLQIETGYPVYPDYHELSDAYRLSAKDTDIAAKAATRALEHTTEADRIHIFQDFMAGGDFSKMDPKLAKKASAVGHRYDHLAEPGDCSAQLRVSPQVAEEGP
jgi:hypothetical protein